jgi:hypothetical protein
MSKLVAVKNFPQQLPMLVDFNKYFLVNLLALKFGMIVVIIKIMLCQTFHGK